MRVLLLLLTLLCSQHAYSDNAKWCYAAEKLNMPSCIEPSKWATAGNACGGKRQSPVGIHTKSAIINEELKPFSFKGYDKSYDVEIENTGYSAQVFLSPDISISGGGLSRQFQASGMHFHWGDGKHGGSEHMINNVRYPAELHIIHKRIDRLDGAPLDDFNFAVLAFPLKEVPQDNPEYTPLIDALKMIPHQYAKTTIYNVKLNGLIPGVEKRNHYFRYTGSLTIPGCNESVIWTVFEDETQLSKRQIEAFSEYLFFPDGKTKMFNNYRPLQELHNRVIYRSSVSTCLLQGTTIFITSALFYLVTELQH